MEEEVGQLIA